MGEDESKRVEFEREVVVISSPSREHEKDYPTPAAAASIHVKEKTPNLDPSENALVPLLVHDVVSPKTPPILEKVTDEGVQKSSGDSIDRDTALARVVTEKRLALVKAWEESEKTKAINKAYKKLSEIGSWENTKKASVDAKLIQIEEELEKEKAIQVEKMKNKMAKIHQAAEEKRALVEAKKGEDILKVEEVASKYRTTGTNPMKVFKCFGF